MALVVVNLTDTFNEWRTKDNQRAEQVGDLSSLATSNQTSIVDALNESLQNVVEDLTPQLGGPLDVNGKSIVSVGAADIVITPHTTGDVRLETDKVKVGSSGEDATITTNGSGSLTIAPNDGGAGQPGVILENAGRVLVNCVSGQPVIIDGDVTATSFTGNILGSGSIAGTVTGTTQAASNNSTKLATTAYVDAQVATENTLEEMDDTTMSGLADLNILQYDLGTTSWKNRTMTAAGIPTSGFTVAMAIALG